MTSQRKLLDLQFQLGVPTFLVRELKQRNALPKWWSLFTENPNGDWVANFHRAFTQGSPRHIQEVAAGSIQASLSPQANVSGEGGTIAFPIGTVVLLHELLEIVFGNLIPPTSRDPAACMLISREGRTQSIQQLQAMIGRLRATNAPNCSSEIAEWTPGVIAAVHFMYVHELSHVSNFHRAASTTSFHDEFEADALAYLWMLQTYRSYPDSQQVFSLVGPFLAIALEAVKEAAFSVDEWDRTHPQPADRVRFLRDRAHVTEDAGLVPPGTVAAGDAFWSMFSDLMLQPTASMLPSSDPVVRLLSGDMNDACVVTSVIQWCAFGSVRKVGESLSRESRITTANPVDHRVIQRLLAETQHLEPNLGLAQQLLLPLAVDIPSTRYKQIATRLISAQLDTLSKTPVDSDLMQMWLRVLFQTLTMPTGAGEEVHSLLAEHAAADAAFAASAVQCKDLIQDLDGTSRRAQLCRDAVKANVPRIVVLTTWLVAAFERGWQDGAKDIDSYRPLRVAKLLVMFGFLMRRDAPGIVSLLLEEWTRRGN